MSLSRGFGPDIPSELVRTLGEEFSISNDPLVDAAVAGAVEVLDGLSDNTPVVLSLTVDERVVHVKVEW